MTHFQDSPCTHHVGVVIPTLNETQCLPKLLTQLFEVQGMAVGHVVVADCRSADGTAEMARRHGVAVVELNPTSGRGGALRAGVAGLREVMPEATAVWMLHADTVLPEGALASVTEALSDSGTVGGAFDFRIETRGAAYVARRSLRVVQWINRQRSRRSRVFFGDQGLFVRLDALDAVGGIPDRPILEDVELCERLIAHFGKNAMVLRPERMTTSNRRFLRHGPVRQGLHDAAILMSLKLGGSGRWWARHYNVDNAQPTTDMTSNPTRGPETVGT